jgi:hypothetical protein
MAGSLSTRLIEVTASGQIFAADTGAITMNADATAWRCRICKCRTPDGARFHDDCLRAALDYLKEGDPDINRARAVRRGIRAAMKEQNE